MSKQELQEQFDKLLLMDRDCSVEDDPAAHMLFEIIFREEDE